MEDRALLTSWVSVTLNSNLLIPTPLQSCYKAFSNTLNVFFFPFITILVTIVYFNCADDALYLHSCEIASENHQLKIEKIALTTELGHANSIITQLVTEHQRLTPAGLSKPDIA